MQTPAHTAATAAPQGSALPQFQIRVSTVVGPLTYLRSGGASMDHLIEALDVIGFSGRASVRKLAPLAQGGAL